MWVEGGYEWGMPMNTTWEKVGAEEPVGAASVELSIAELEVCASKQIKTDDET